MAAAGSPRIFDSARGADGPEGRRRILDVAAALFLERGYVGTSLRDIARAVGMKPGSLYYHFASKEALLEAILERGMEVMVAAFTEIMSPQAGAKLIGRALLAAMTK